MYNSRRGDIFFIILTTHNISKIKKKLVPTYIYSYYCFDKDDILCSYLFFFNFKKPNLKKKTKIKKQNKKNSMYLQISVTKKHEQ